MEPLIFVIVALVMVAGLVMLLSYFAAKPPPAKGGDKAETMRRSAREMERFLEEINRRRRLAEGRGAPEQPPRPQPPATPQAARPRPTPAKPTRPSPNQRVQQAPRQRPVEVVVAEVVEEVTAPPPSVTKPMLRAPRRKASPTAAQVTALLRTPQSLRTAFILKEIFDKPLSSRRRAR